MKNKKNNYLLCVIIVILIFQLLITGATNKVFINYRFHYLDSNAGPSIVATAQKFSSWRQIYGSAYEDDENTGGAGHGNVRDLENRINHHFTSGYGVNCSGFVRAVIYSATGTDVMENGIYIENIVNSGYFTEISESQLKPGDIFYTNAGSAGHHIGIITEVLGFDNNGTATFRTAESDSGNWTRVITKYDYYAGAGIYQFLRLNVDAKNKSDIEAIKRWAESDNGEYSIEDIGNTCSIVNGKSDDESLANILSIIFGIISIIGIVSLIIMSIIEFIKVITGQDEDGIKKAFKNSLIRLLCVVILLLLPILLSSIISVTNKASDGKIVIGDDGELFCDVIK